MQIDLSLLKPIRLNLLKPIDLSLLRLTDLNLQTLIDSNLLKPIGWHSPMLTDSSWLTQIHLRSLMRID